MGDLLQVLKKSKARRFNDDTKIRSFKGIEKVPYSEWPDHWKKVDYKAYPRMEQILLPAPEDMEWSLSNALMSRKSKREFTKREIKINDFSNLLFYSAGLKHILCEREVSGRFYPSAGARYPLEVYPFVFNVETLDSSGYHYHLRSHSLEKILGKPFYNKVMRQFDQPWIYNSAILIVVSAVFDRTEEKYGSRGLRHIYTEYGHLAQNISLIATESNLGVCSVGGFIDDGLNDLLDFDMVDESVIGVLAIGIVE